jgi:hypothetical protein
MNAYLMIEQLEQNKIYRIITATVTNHCTI